MAEEDVHIFQDGVSSAAGKDAYSLVEFDSKGELGFEAESTSAAAAWDKLRKVVARISADLDIYRNNRGFAVGHSMFPFHFALALIVAEPIHKPNLLHKGHDFAP